MKKFLVLTLVINLIFSCCAQEGIRQDHSLLDQRSKDALVTQCLIPLSFSALLIYFYSAIYRPTLHVRNEHIKQCIVQQDTFKPYENTTMPLDVKKKFDASLKKEMKQGSGKFLTVEISTFGLIAVCYAIAGNSIKNMYDTLKKKLECTGQASYSAQ